MQATALSGRPKVLLGRKKVHSGDPTGAVACMRALLVCPISNKEGFCGVWGQKNAQKALVLIKPEAIMAELDTIWVKMLLSLKHGELFSEMALWPTPNGGSGLPWRKMLPHVDAPNAAQATRINSSPLLFLLCR